MNIRRKSKITSEVSTSSLNDIMFFLLLFFLIASTLANPNVIKVLLPKAKSSQEFHKQKPVTVTVDKDLKYYIDRRPIQKEELKDELTALKGNNTDFSVVLVIDSSVDWQYVAEILDMGKSLDIKMVAAARKK